MDPLATVDDGSCAGCLVNSVTITMYDSWGDGWNGNTYTITDSTGAVVATGTLATGSLGVDTLCLPDGCYDITVGGGSFPSEVSFDFGTLVGAPVGTYTGQCFPAVTLIYGCTNPRFMRTMTQRLTLMMVRVQDVLHNEVALEMFDSFGDGWNGSTYTVTDASGNVVATGGLLTGSYGVDTLCLPDGCYDITVRWWFMDFEVSFNFVSLSGAGVGTYTGICVPQPLLITATQSSASSVRLTGPWWGWNPLGGPVAADNGDGTWTTHMRTWNTMMEYKKTL